MASTYEELIAKSRELAAAGDMAGAKRVAQIAISRRGGMVPVPAQTNMVEQSMSGVNEGIGGMLGLPVDAISGAMNGAGYLFGRDVPLIDRPVGGSQWFNEGILKPTISETPPQTAAQRYGRRIGQEVGASVIPGGASLRAATAPLSLVATELASSIGAGIAGQTAREVAPDSIAADVISSLIGGIAPVAGARLARSGPQAPSIGALRQQQDAAYEAVDNSQARLDPAQRQGLIDQMDNRTAGMDMDPFLHPRAKRTMERMDSLEPSPLISDVEKKRRLVGRDVAGSLDPSEAALGQAMKGEIDTYLKSIADQGGLGADAAETLARLEEARMLTQRIKKSDTVVDALTKAERRAASSGTGGNEVNAVRQNIRAILDNPKKRRGYSAAEIAQMESIVRGSIPVNALRLAGRLSPTSGALPMMANMAAMAGGATGGAAGIALTAIPGSMGMIAKALAEGMTKGQIDKLMATIRNGGPLPGKGINQNDYRAAIAALLSQGSSLQEGN